MQTFSNDISDTLQLQGQCFLPGIGLLHIVRSPAEKSYQENQLNPPSYEIVLDPSIRGGLPASSIERRIADVHGIPIEEATKRWEETAAEIREKLSTGSSVALEGLGFLNIGEEGNISFVGTHVPSPIYTSLSLASLKEMAGRAAAPKPTDPETQQPETAQGDVTDNPASWEPVDGPAEDMEPGRQPKPRWWIIGSIVVLILVGWFTYRGTMQRRKRATNISRILQKQHVPASQRLAVRDSLALKSDSIGNAPAGDDSIHYFIVIATYKNEDRALRQYKKMRNWGHPVELRTTDSLTYKLAFHVTSLPVDTTVNLVNMMKLYGEKTHIEYDLDQ